MHLTVLQLYIIVKGIIYNTELFFFLSEKSQRFYYSMHLYVRDITVTLTFWITWWNK